MSSAALYLYTFALLPNSADAEDVFQEANLVLWRKFDQYQTGTNFFAWACKVIRYEVLKYREKAPRAVTLLHSDVLDRLAEVAVVQVEGVDQFHRLAFINCMDGLSVADREAHASALYLGDGRTGDGRGNAPICKRRLAIPGANPTASVGLHQQCRQRSGRVRRRTITSSSYRWQDFDLLLNRVVDGLHTEEDLKQFNSILRVDVEACRHYVSYIGLHGQLAWGTGTREDARGGQTEESINGRQSSIKSSFAMFLLRKPLKRRNPTWCSAFGI